jgi:hypothetical protein
MATSKILAHVNILTDWLILTDQLTQSYKTIKSNYVSIINAMEPGRWKVFQNWDTFQTSRKAWKNN